MFLRQMSDEINNDVWSRTIRMRSQGGNIPGRIARKVPLLRPHNLRSRLNFTQVIFHGRDLKVKRNKEILY